MFDLAYDLVLNDVKQSTFHTRGKHTDVCDVNIIHMGGGVLWGGHRKETSATFLQTKLLYHEVGKFLL